MTIWAQTTLINSSAEGGFESGSSFAANGWTVVNGSATSTQNQWYLGTAATAGLGSGNAAYITNNTGTGACAYTNNGGLYTVHFYRDITFPAGETLISLSFVWKGVMETSAYDGLQVSLAATSVTPAVATAAPTGLVSTNIVSGATVLGSALYYNSSSSAGYSYFIPSSVAGNSVSASTMRLIFTFRMDGSGGTSPAVSIDNISLTTQAPNPLHGIYTINNTLPTTSPMIHDGTGNFNSFSDAINNINGNGLTGAVTFNVTSGQTFAENPPALLATGTVANTITFQKNGAGANPKITPTGTTGTADFGFAVAGGDYITVDGIDIDASASAAVEYGYYVYNAAATNGAQNNAFKNMVITMGNRGGSSSGFGIYQYEPVTASSATGANSGNKYYNFTISGVRNGGVSMSSSTASYPGLSNELGTTACNTRNSISNTGPTVSTSLGSFGIYVSNQSGIKIFNNDISAVAGDQGTSYGIQISGGQGTTNEVYGNKISNISIKGSTTTTTVAYGIKADLNISYTSNLKVYNNFISNIYTSYTSSATANRYAIGLYVGIASATSSQTYDVDNNTISMGYGLAPTYSNACIELQNVSAVYRVRGNIFANFTGAQGTTAKHFGIVATSATLGATGTAFDYNDYYIATDQSTSGHVGRISTTNYNLITDWKTATTGTLDETSISGDPSLVQPNTNLHSSSLVTNAVSGFSTQAWVTSDIDCQTRSAMSPADMGADAYDVASLDIGMTGLVSPATTGCYGAAQPITVSIKNYGSATVDFSVNPATLTMNVSGAVTQTLTHTVNTGSLGIGSSQNVTFSSTLNMTATGVYTFNGSTAVVGDGNALNDAMSTTTRTVVAPVSLPQTVDFTGYTGANLTSVFPNWSEAFGPTSPSGTTSAWLNGALSSTTAKVNLYSNTKREWIVGPRIIADAGTLLSFDMAITDYNLTTADPSGMAGTDDSMIVKISTDCGNSFSNLYAYTSANTGSISNTPVPQIINLSAYAGQTIIIAFYASEGTVDNTPDYDVHIDNILLGPACAAPVSQPTVLTFSSVTLTAMTAGFSPAPGSPSGYLTVRYPSGAGPVNPVNGVTYAVGAALGSGVVAGNSNGTSIAITNLLPGTTYDYYVYAYNNSGCSGGPAYNLTAPLAGSQATASCPVFNPVISIGPGGDYSYVADALYALRICGITQPTVLELSADYYLQAAGESFPMSLNRITGMSATNTITIRPAASVVSPVEWTSGISGGMIAMDSSSYWILDGRPGGSGNSKMLTIECTNTSNVLAPSVAFINGAKYNQVSYVNLKSASPYTLGGTVYFGNSVSTNTSNIISFSDISSSAAGLAANGIYSSSSLGSNDSNSIVSNNIYDIFNAAGETRAVYIGSNCNHWTLSGNSFYQRVSRTLGSGAGSAYSCIYSSAANNGLLITGNYIGGTGPGCSGGNTVISNSGSGTIVYKLFDITAGTTKAASIQGNIFRNLDLSTGAISDNHSFLYLNSGKISVGNLSGNLIGQDTGRGNINFRMTGSSTTNSTFSVFNAGSGTPDSMNIVNNSIGSLEITSPGSGYVTSRLIWLKGASGIYNVSNNLFGSASTANSISASTVNPLIVISAGAGGSASVIHSISGNTISNVTQAATSTVGQFVGILAAGNSGGRYSVTGNVLKYLRSSGVILTAAGSGSAFIGISHTAATTAGQTISGNSIYGMICNSPGAVDIIGLFYGGPTTGSNLISNNKIGNLVPPSGISAGVYGMLLAGASGNADVVNNMICLGADTLGSGIATEANFYGIREGITNSYHRIAFNSVQIGGSGNGIAGTGLSYSFSSLATAGTRLVRNNVFSDVRTSVLGGSSHYSISLAGITGLTINNNDYWTGSSFLAKFGSGNITGLSSWQASTGQDQSSISQNPIFSNPFSPVIDLHIDGAGGANYLESAGENLAWATSDIDGDVRPGPAGSVRGGGTSSDIGADEFDGQPAYTCASVDAGNAVSSVPFICSSGSATLSLSGTSLAGSGYTFSWQSSADSLVFSDIPGGNLATYTTGTISQTSFFRCMVTCLNGNVSDSSGVVKITVYNPAIIAVNSAVRCGTGTVTLSASSSANTGINWYTTETGGSPVATGSSYTTPSLSTTTNYYISAASVALPASGGRTAPTVTSYSTNLTGYGLRFNANSAFTLNSVDLFNAGAAAAVTIQLQNSAGTVLQSITTPTIPAGVGTAATTVNLGWSISAGTGYRLFLTGNGGSSFTSELAAGGFPYNISSYASITEGYNSSGGSSTNYFYFYNWQVSGFCESGRTMVTATVNTPPVVSISPASATICSGQSVTLTSSSSNDPNYSYSWTGGATGSSITVSPTSQTTYTVTATDTTSGGYSGCMYSASAVISVTPSPVISSFSAASSTVCSPGSTTLTASAAVGGSNSVSATSGALSLSVPDGSLTGVSSNLTLSGASGNIGADNVITATVSITHPYNSDLDIYLVGPGNCGTLELSTDNGSSGDNYSSVSIITPSSLTSITSAPTSGAITGSWKAEGTYNAAPGLASGISSGTYSLPATAISGCPVNGTWKLFVADDASSDVGTLTSWSLNITYPITYTAQFSGPGTFGGSITYSGTGNSTASIPVSSIPLGSNTYTVQMTSSLGCSATATTGVTVNPTPTASITGNNGPVCKNSNVVFTLNGTANAVVTYKINGGVNQNITLNGSGSGTVTITAATTNQTLSLVSVSNGGCSQTVSGISIATVRQPTTSTTNTSICSNALPYSWNSNSYSQAGTYSVTLVNYLGCDSIATLNLSVTTSSVNTTTAAACDSYTWSDNGVTYTQSGVYTGSTVSCVTRVLNLTITTSTSSTTTASSCDSYSWSVTGLTYTQSGTYSMVVGCHTDYLQLTITQSNSYSQSESACYSYYWSVDGSTYTQSGTYSYVTGCDTYILHLIILTKGEAGTVSGPATVCLGGTGNYITGGDGGGVWETSDTSLAIIDASTGVLTGQGSGTVQVRYIVTNSCGADTAVQQVIVYDCSQALFVNLKLYIQGLYAGSGLMVPSLMNSGIAGAGAGDADSIVVELHNPSTGDPEGVPVTAILHTDGTCQAVFPPATGSRYIVVRHRNAVETWTALPVAVTGVVNYDFTTAASQAYGSNQANMGDGNFAFWSGDVNQDGMIETTDYSLMENDVISILFGYFITDLTGDGIVETSDYSLMENNVIQIIFAAKPF